MTGLRSSTSCSRRWAERTTSPLCATLSSTSAPQPATFLPTGGRGVSLADPAHPISSETRTEGWHAVDGIKFPARIINIHDGKKLAEITVEDTRLNRGLKQAELARKPADLKPEMGR